MRTLRIITLMVVLCASGLVVGPGAASEVVWCNSSYAFENAYQGVDGTGMAAATEEHDPLTGSFSTSAVVELAGSPTGVFVTGPAGAVSAFNTGAWAYAEMTALVEVDEPGRYEVRVLFDIDEAYAAQGHDNTVRLPPSGNNVVVGSSSYALALVGLRSHYSSDSSCERLGGHVHAAFADFSGPALLTQTMDIVPTPGGAISVTADVNANASIFGAGSSEARVNATVEDVSVVRIG